MVNQKTILIISTDIAYWNVWRKYLLGQLPESHIILLETQKPILRYLKEHREDISIVVIDPEIDDDSGLLFYNEHIISKEIPTIICSSNPNQEDGWKVNDRVLKYSDLCIEQLANKIKKHWR